MDDLTYAIVNLLYAFEGEPKPLEDITDEEATIALNDFAERKRWHPTMETGIPQIDQQP